MTETLKLAVAGANVELDPWLGSLRGLTFAGGQRVLSPLHSAPWLDEPAIQADLTIPPVERRLSGDFFCAPFGASDDGPIHGWTANSAWTAAEMVHSGRAAVARLELQRSVRGACVEKELRLRPDEPILYQSHIITGGEGALPVAHHPMLRLSGGDAITFSPKQMALTGDTPPEPGRNWLRYPAAGTDLRRFPGAEGAVDLGQYPKQGRHEDFVTLVEAAGNSLGWTAVIRRESNDIVFFLKDPRVLPVTMLWYSNGGRDYSPWKGRHIGVLGIEDGCTAGSGQGEAAVLDRLGVPTGLALRSGQSHVIRHAIGCIPRPAGWRSIVAIAQKGPRLVLTEEAGESLEIPFDPRFFIPSARK